MKKWPEIQKLNLLSAFFHKKSYSYYWSALFTAYQTQRIPSWDGALVFALWSKSGLCMAPKHHLIQNIGFT